MDPIGKEKVHEILSMKSKVGSSVSAKNMISNNLYLELQTTIYK